MSRSYKSTPRCGDNKSNGYKQIYNRRIRRLLKREELSESSMLYQGNYYKKVNNQYDICDYETVHYSFREYVVSYRERFAKHPFKDEKEKTLDELYVSWRKIYLQK